jgi:hypothetical protein
MIKKKLFIGSSSEELSLAERAKSQLENDFDVQVWNDKVWDTAVFKLNQNFLADLLKASLKYDFGILIGTEDDKVVIRGKEVMKPRDNVIFELGLFTGRLGTSKCAFLIEKKIDLLSDFTGITLARFDKLELATFDSAVSQIKELFLSSNEDELNFFPSATLAAVYYENFIVPTCRYIIDAGGFTCNNKLYEKCKINVIIPNHINDDVNLQWEQMKKTKFVTQTEQFKYAGRDRKIIIDSRIKDEQLELIDCPTVLTGINHAIENLLPNEFTKLNPDYDFVLERELRRFITTLKKLLIKGGFDEMVTVRRESDL